MDTRIKLYRKIDEWWWRSKPNTFSLFIYLLTNANLEEKTYQWYTIKRGDCVTWLYSLSDALGITVRWIRTSLEHLKSTNEVTIKTTNKFSIITVVWFDKYQSKETKMTNRKTSKSTNNWQSNDNQTTTPKEYNNKIKKEIIYIKEKQDIKWLLSNEEIEQYKPILEILWYMFLLKYKCKLDRMSLILLIEWMKDTIITFCWRKEDWTPNYWKWLDYIKRWYDYWSEWDRIAKNHKSSVKRSFAMYSGK